MADLSSEETSITEDKKGQTPSKVNGGIESKQKCSDCSQCLRINKRLLPSKLFYFFFFGGLGSVFPYMTIYFKQLGLDPMRIGLLSGIRPFIGFLSGPIWGAVADRYRTRRLMLMLSLCGWIGAVMAIGFVPAAKEGKCPVSANAVHHYLNKSQRLHSLSEESVAAARKVRAMSDVTHLTCGSCELPESVWWITDHKSIVPRRYERLGNKKRSAKAEGEAIESYIAVMQNQEDSSWLYDEESLQRLFILLAALMIFGEFLQSPTTALADTATLDNLENNLDKYGHQRVWGALGLGASSFAVGAMINTTRKTVTKCGIVMTFSDYHIAFYVFGGMMGTALLVATRLKFADRDGDQPSKHNLVSLLKLLCSVHFMSILLVAFFMGVCNGLVYGFLFWHLENLGASQLLLGTASVMIYGSEVVMFFLTYRLISLIGHVRILYLGLICYAIRFLIYSYLVDPWWVMPAEILQGITFAAVWTVLASYLALAVPNDSFATMQGILHGIYWGLGTGVGNMLGGLFVDFFGAVRTFIGYSIASCVVLVIFAMVQRVCPRPKYLDTGYDELEGDVNMKPPGEDDSERGATDDESAKRRKSLSSMSVEVAAAKAIPGPDFD
ncbi:major facilitator superfamily domain-containing protein 6-like [Ptychodera flava]|uniref:major facilitator superfamily domain-containing protein 6-like n=1 Tax=Ptychodera flava TaxID=63121 RepID=UPI00396AB124